MIIEAGPNRKEFQPIRLEIVFESQEELLAFQAMASTNLSVPNTVVTSEDRRTLLRDMLTRIHHALLTVI